MNDCPKAMQATPSTTLREQIMNSNYPKNEREWWAARTIENLEKDNAKLREHHQRDEALIGQRTQEAKNLEADNAALRAWICEMESAMRGARASGTASGEALARAECAELRYSLHEMRQHVTRHRLVLKNYQDDNDSLRTALRNLERVAGQPMMYDDPARVAARTALAEKESK